MTGVLAQAFAAAQRTLLVPYITAGFPDLDATVPIMHAMQQAGADIIELGVPFTDPAADGPVIQRANEQALAAGASLTTAIAAAAAYRDSGGTLPVVLMGYANPFLRMEPAKLAHACADAGIAGILAVDWPPSAGDDLGTQLAQEQIDRIALVAPTTPDERVKMLAQHASGYLYYVAIKGVTGTSATSASEVVAAGKHLSGLSRLPVAVGFGISDPQTCKLYAQAFAAVVVGSKLIAAAAAAGSAAPDAVGKILAPMRAAIA